MTTGHSPTNDKPEATDRKLAGRRVSPERARARIWLNGALAIGATIAALALAELVVRLLGVGSAPAIVTQESPEFFVRSAVEGLGYEIRPNFAGRAYGCDLKINSRGMRSPEHPVEKSKGVQRVLVLGDSVAFGLGVEQSATFPALLEGLLAERASATSRVELLNAAVPGYNSAQQRIFLERRGFVWQPDVVVVVAVVNDAEPAYELGENGGLKWEETPEVYREAYERYIAGRGLGGFLRRHVRVFALLDSLLHRPFFLTRRYLDYLDDLYTVNSAGWLSMREALVAMKATCQARDVGFVLVYCPVPMEREPEVFRRIREKIGEFARSERIVFLDLYDAQSSRPAKQITISPLDRHPNALGHRLIAEALAPLLAHELARERPTSTSATLDTSARTQSRNSAK